MSTNGENSISIDIALEMQGNMTNVNGFVTLLKKMIPNSRWEVVYEEIFRGIDINDQQFIEKSDVIAIIIDIRSGNISKILRYIFFGVDTDKDGILTFEEIHCYLKKLIFVVSDEELTKFLREKPIDQQFDFNFFHMCICGRLPNENNEVYHVNKKQSSCCLIM